MWNLLVDTFDKSAEFLDNKVFTSGNIKLGVGAAGLVGVAVYGKDAIDYVGDKYDATKAFLLGREEDEEKPKSKKKSSKKKSSAAKPADDAKPEVKPKVKPKAKSKKK